MKRIIKIVVIALVTLLIIALAVTALTYFKVIRLPWLEESYLFRLLPGVKAEQALEETSEEVPPEVGELPIVLPVDAEGNPLPLDPLLQEVLDKYQALQAEKSGLEETNAGLEAELAAAAAKQEEMLLKDALLAEWETKEADWNLSEANYRQQIDILNQQLVDNDISANNQLRAEQVAAYKNLANYYMQMNTQKAADIMANLDNNEVIGIFDQMDQETVAALLERLPKEKAVSLSKQMLLVSP
jgi:flagellar motility protein MotE (MotC chaperone)